MDLVTDSIYAIVCVQCGKPVSEAVQMDFFPEPAPDGTVGNTDLCRECIRAAAGVLGIPILEWTCFRDKTPDLTGRKTRVMVYLSRPQCVCLATFEVNGLRNYPFWRLDDPVDGDREVPVRLDDLWLPIPLVGLPATHQPLFVP